MSLLEALTKKRSKLRPTDSRVRRVDGSQIIELASGGIQRLERSSYGFVVDTKPDKIPAEILEGQLFVGSQDAVDKDVLTQFNIGAVLSVGIECPIQLPDGIVGNFIQCLDVPETDFSLPLTESIEFIAECLKSNKRVLVHCNAGVSRSTSVVLGYLIRNCCMSFEDAFRLVKLKRPAAQPNVGFLRFLQSM